MQIYRILGNFSKHIFKRKYSSNTKSFFFHLQQNNLMMDANFDNVPGPGFGFKILPSPVKSASDKKEYTVIQLDNGLTACLISDKEPIVNEDESCEESSDESEGSETESSDSDADSCQSSESKQCKSGSSASELKMAAAGLCIGVGSFSDPKDVPGMAHFLEHMVFMGSEKFPAENDFDSFIKKGGGSDNASTDSETTCFYFECLEKHLHEALDKFAQFFIAPLMKKGAMTREREAIESEFQMALPSDWSRKEQLLCSFSKKDSPVNSFAWGNLITLKENIDDDKLYEGVHEFRKRHYSAHRMTLAIQARLPTETLQKYVVECFSKVPNNELPANDFTVFSNGLFETPEFNRLYYMKPTKDSCQVDLTWSLPPLREKYKSKPVQYVSFLMGDEGKGSLLSYLKKKMWAISTSIGNGEGGSEDNSMYTLYTVSIVLTEEGLKNISEVIGVVFSYINLMKRLGPQKRIFDELKSIGDTAFQFATEEPASDMVENLCEDMQFYPPEDYIAGSELYYEFDPQAIEMVVDNLRPRNMNVMILTKNSPNGEKFDKVEKWFGTEYTDKDIPEEWLIKWENTEPYPDLAFPPPNPYLTSDFSLLPETVDHPDYPVKVTGTPLVEMWYRKDQKFKLPIAYYNFYLISPKSVESPASISMSDMFMNLLAFSIAEEAYPASSADLMYSFNSYEKGIIIKVNGYNEKLPILVDLVANYLVTFDNHVTEGMFNAVKDKLLKSYHNRLLKPSAFAKDIRLNLLLNNYWKPTDRYLGLSNTTYGDMKNFIKDYTKSLYIKSLVQGNVSQEVACEVVNKFVETLKSNHLSEEQYPLFRVAQVPIGEKCCRIEGFNKTDANSVIVNYYQSSPFSMETSVIIDIIMMMIEEPLFDILRTKEQLGYHVFCSTRDTFGILGFTITVNTQATKYSTSHVDQRIEEFLRHTRSLLKKTSEAELEEIKEDLIKTKQCTDIHLKEEVDRNWSEIVSDDYIFDRIKREVEMIRKIKIGEIRSWWSRHNRFGKQENFRKISIQGTISPKLQISTKTTIEETLYDADPINPNNTLVKPKSTLYKQPSQKGCSRKVCHSIAFSRAQKNVPLRKTNSKPPFKYSKVSDDLILRSNPNIVLRNDTDHGDRITSEPSCYCMTKYPKNAWSETGDDNLSRSNEDLGNISTKGLIHSNKCSLCSLYEGYFPSKSSKMKSSCNSLLAHRTKPRLCAYCEQNYIRKQPRSRSGSPCRSDVTDSSRRRVCFCLSAERATSLSRQLHKKLSNALDTNSRLFQNCIDCED
ncbi:unnamed protein product [Phaedon cochleariae]|uniref:Nardilysin n=1 Tax=Phaedon cochleariae TaxID=80249 RepID=A0A9P0GM53_PHACE|nr:unnamed protein product [Phaedon cochleariae]